MYVGKLEVADRLGQIRVTWSRGVEVPTELRRLAWRSCGVLAVIRGGSWLVADEWRVPRARHRPVHAARRAQPLGKRGNKVASESVGAHHPNASPEVCKPALRCGIVELT